MLKPIVVRLTGALLILGTVAGSPALADPAAVQMLLMEALDHGDVGGALAPVTDDAVIDMPTGFFGSARGPGKTGSRRDPERITADRSKRVTALNTTATREVLLTRFQARSAITQTAGVDRRVLWGNEEARDDKIAPARCLLQRTDSPTARLTAWENARPTVQ
jgi:hypothetical protein